MRSYKNEEAKSKPLFSGIEQDAQKLIVFQLLRLNRTVKINEMAFVPVIDEVLTYIEAIKLDGAGSIVIVTSFADVEEKHLSAFICDNEITHWQLIELLEMLMKTT